MPEPPVGERVQESVEPRRPLDEFIDTGAGKARPALS